MRSTVVTITDRRLRAVCDGIEVLTSLEGENPGGSIKDWMVEGELKRLLDLGRLEHGQTIAEISAGSTALSLAHYARRFRVNCLLFVPRTLETEKRAALEALGAKLELVDTKTAFADFARFIETTGMLKFDQFGKRSLSLHYAGLAKQVGGSVGAVIGSVGTGHSLVGVAEGFGSPPKIVSAEPDTVAAIPGIRNVRLEHFGENDPCEIKKLTRIEVSSSALFPAGTLETDVGPIEISETFRVVLSALEKWSKDAGHSGVKSIFTVGAANKKAA